MYYHIPTTARLEIVGSQLTLTEPNRRPFGHRTEVILIDQQLGYIPIPKNGSTSIRHMLRLANIPHTSIYDTKNNPEEFFKQFSVPLFTIVRRDVEQRLVSGINEYLKRTGQVFHEAMLKNLPLDEHSTYQASYLVGVNLKSLTVLSLGNAPSIEKYINDILATSMSFPSQNKSAANDIESLRQRIKDLPEFKNYLDGEQATVDNIIKFKFKP